MEAIKATEFLVIIIGKYLKQLVIKKFLKLLTEKVNNQIINLINL